MQAIVQALATDLRAVMNEALDLEGLHNSIATAQSRVIALIAPMGDMDDAWVPPDMDPDVWEKTIFNKIKTSPWSVQADAETVLSFPRDTKMNSLLITLTATELYRKYLVEDQRLLRAAEIRRVDASTQLLHDFKAKNDANEAVKAALRAHKLANDAFQASRQEHSQAKNTEAKIIAAIQRKRDQA